MRPESSSRERTYVYDAVIENGASRHVPSSSTPRLVVGSARFTSSTELIAETGCRTRDANSVTVADAAPKLRVRSKEALRPRSAESGVGIERRDKPVDSVSSVKGVGAKKPWPADRRLVQPSKRNSAESRAPKAIVEIRPPAGRERKPRRNFEIVLYENSRRDVVVGEARNIAGMVRVPVDGSSGHPRVPPGCPADRYFAEHQVVPVALARFAEAVIVKLPRSRHACGDYEPFAKR